MRRYLAILIGAVALVAGCTAADDDDAASEASGDSTTTGGSADDEAIVDDRAPGVAEDTVRVGVPYVDFSSLRERGVTINHGDYETAYQSVADAINDDGGIHGRTIELTFGPVDPSVDATTQETCTRLTQDDPVFVAVGRFVGDDVLCYVSVGETAVIGGTMSAERLEEANAPWYTTDSGEDLQTDAARFLADEGHLDGAVAVVGMAVEQSLVEQSIVPALEDQGVDLVETALIDAPSDDTAANTAAARTIAERFEASGADTVVVAGTAPQPFNLGLAQTGYRPQLAFTNTASVDSYINADGSDLSILEDAVAASYYGPADDQLELPGVTAECFEIQRAAGLVINRPSTVPEGEPNQFAASYYACQQLYLLRAILEAAGPELDYGTFQTAGNQLGEVELPGAPEPFTFGPPPSADGDPQLYAFEFDPSTDTLVRVD